mgnify:CR=1 FL=1
MKQAMPHHQLPPHGGPDALGVPAWDFSTNSNAAGPCPHTLAALAQTDARRYPDPSYSALRSALAALHQVSPQRVLMGASGSELIARLTGWCAWRARHAHTQSPAECPTVPAKVWLPAHAYGDYAHATHLHGLHIYSSVADANLIWLCAPSSPHGQALTLPPQWHARQRSATVVLDCAYAPLQLSQTPIAPGLDRNSCWQIWTPNKALGLCGIRAAYTIAPEQADAQAAEPLAEQVAELTAWAPSWPIGSHGVALLHSWCTPETQAWLAQARTTLQHWKQQQIALLHGLGWQCAPSETNFFIARPPAPIALPRLLVHLRQHGIKLRDATSFGLPGWVRLCVHTPQAQAALAQQLAAFA